MEFVFYFVVLAVLLGFAVLSGAMALKRGRDGAVWFLVGYFTGPLAMIALALFPLPPNR